MRFLLVTSIFFVTSLSASTTFLTQVNRLESSSLPHEETLVFLSTGQVAKVSRAETNLLNKVNQSARNHQWLKVTLDNERMIEKAIVVNSPMKTSADDPMMGQENLADYSPSVIANIEDAKTIFRDHRIPKDGETQCFNRAQVWVYDWRSKRNIYANKTWVFFTAKYIRKYNFEWWFHVAPSVNVNIDGKIKERVMDMKYARGPLDTKKWTDIFLKDDAVCPTVTTYSDHADYPESGSCFLQKSNMYFYQPVDLEFKEKFGTDKQAWVTSEVIEAYREAFDIYL